MVSEGARGGPIRVGCGPREVEAALLAELQRASAEAVRNEALLSTPIRVIVPSGSLRKHLAAALMRATGRAVLGLEIQTLHGAALEILERAGIASPYGDGLFPVLVRQFARRERALADRLDVLADGYAVVAEVVSDLLDAGLTREHADALEEALEETPGPRGVRARAAASVRVAVKVQAAMAASGIGHRSHLISLAREALERDPDVVLPARRVFIHGFAETTGLRSELLEALVRERAAEVYFDLPPDPAQPIAGAHDWSFARRLHDRLAGSAGVVVAGAVPEPAQLTPLVAAGSDAEVRAVAERIRKRLDAGARPESIAVVARNLERYRAPLRRHFERVGVPFSGVGEVGSVGASWRLGQSLLDLLQRREQTPCDRWLDVACKEVGAGEGADLRLALRSLGLVRIAALARHRAGRGDVRLPVFGAWEEDSEAAGRARARRLPRSELLRVIALAQATLQRLDTLGSSATFAALIAGVRELLTRDLGWDPDDEMGAPIFSALAKLASDQPPGFALDFDDFLPLVAREFRGVGVGPIGGAGAGVQVLTVMEARARSFDALYLLGLNRDVFPRTIRPDPVLPDFLRRAFTSVLPDLPIKVTGHDEERYLFSQLVAASPDVTLSWQRSDDAGRDCARSSLVERLAWSDRIGASEVAPALLSPDYAGLTTPFERALVAGLADGREAFAAALPVAFEAACRALPAGADGGAGARAAASRLSVLAALEPERAGVDPFGPYFGFVGPTSGAGDPRAAALYVTRIENLVRCPWQTFLARFLRLEVPPDPMQSLPGSDQRLVGMVVHLALERIVAAAVPETGRDLAEARTRAGASLVWPAADALDGLLHAAAASVLKDERIAFGGLETILAEQARPFVERAHALDLGGDIVALGAELEGGLDHEGPDGRPRRIAFRVDRVDRIAGELVLTDYKTGKTISDAVKPPTRAGHFLKAVQRGGQLQAVAYARGAGEPGAVGRFVFLKPDIEAEHAIFATTAESDDFGAAFTTALDTALAAWDQGAFFPRLQDESREDINPRCEYCELSLACVQGDTGVRDRVVAGLAAAEARDASERSPQQQALVALWTLAEKSRSSKGEADS